MAMYIFIITIGVIIVFYRGSQSSDSLDDNFPQDLHHYVLTSSQYIITDDYKSVLEELLREPKIILKGPKGCGKSLLLLKLFSDFIREDKQILYLSARTLNKISVKGSMEYFEGSFLQLEGEKCSSHDNCEDRFCSTLTDYCNDSKPWFIYCWTLKQRYTWM